MDRSSEGPLTGIEQPELRAGLRALVASVLASTLLATVKVAAGVAGNAYALIADGIESLLDIVSSLVVWSGLRVAARPADDRFPYGYGRAESLAALVVATVLLVAALGLAIQSVREILTPHHAPAPFTLAVLVLVVAVKELLFRRLRRAGESLGSHALRADAWHHRSDAITSLAAFVGITVALVAGKGYESADDWAALVACGIIAWNGLRLLRGTLAEILDAAPPPFVEERVRDLAGRVSGVALTEKCRVRKSGPLLFVELHVGVDAGMSVQQAHSIAHQVKDAILASELPVGDAVIHIEPAPPG